MYPYKIKPVLKEEYISDKGEKKTLEDWYTWAMERDAFITGNNNTGEAEIVRGTEKIKVILRTIRKY
jgi:hypothetical protein